MAHTQVQLARGNTAAIAAYTGPQGETVINTDDGSLNVQDGATAGGKWKIRAGLSAATAYTAPTTGATITTAQGERKRIVDPSGTIASLTVTLPPSPQDGDEWEGRTSQVITTLTVNAPGGASVVGSGFTAAANSRFSYLYRASTTSWYCGV